MKDRNRAQPQTLVPGAERRMFIDHNGVGVPAVDRRGRPLWNMPKPSGHVLHFKSAAARSQWTALREAALAEAETPGYTEEQRKLSQDRLSQVVQKLTVAVPVYQGIPASMANWLRGQARRKQRLAVNPSMVQRLKQTLGFGADARVQS